LGTANDIGENPSLTVSEILKNNRPRAGSKDNALAAGPRLSLQPGSVEVTVSPRLKQCAFLFVPARVSKSGSLAKLTAIRRASFLVNRAVTKRRRGATARYFLYAARIAAGAAFSFGVNSRRVAVMSPTFHASLSVQNCVVAPRQQVRP